MDDVKRALKVVEQWRYWSDERGQNFQTIHKALRLLVAVETGEWKLVPTQPTEQMYVAWEVEWLKHDPANVGWFNAYYEMLQATPDFFADDNNKCPKCEARLMTTYTMSGQECSQCDYLYEVHDTPDVAADQKECPNCGADRFNEKTGCVGHSWADGGECANRANPYIPEESKAEDD